MGDRNTGYVLKSETEDQVVVAEVEGVSTYRFDRMGPLLWFDSFTQQGETYRMPDVPEAVVEMLQSEGYREVKIER